MKYPKVLITACVGLAAATALILTVHAKDVIIVKNALCTGINKPGVADFKALNVQIGATVSSTTYAPPKGKPVPDGIEAGQKYNMFMITNKDKSQAFIVWSPPDPKWQDMLVPSEGTVYAVGGTDPATAKNLIKEGDRINVRTKEGTLDLTFDWPKATFSVVMKK